MTNEIEGASYVFTRDEIKEQLSVEEAGLFFEHYSLMAIPQFHGHKQAEGGIVHANNIPLSYNRDNVEKLTKVREKILTFRNQRNQPLIDKKAITAWNGLMIEALTIAGAIFQRDDYIKIAVKAANHLLKTLVDSKGNLYRISYGKKRNTKAFLEDYAFLIQALLSLHQATGTKKWLTQAIKLLKKAEENFSDSKEGGFFFSDGKEESLVRIKAGSDAAVPSDNAIMVQNMLTIMKLTGEQKWRKQIDLAIESFYSDIATSPISYCSMVHALLNLPEITPELLEPMEVQAQNSIANDNILDSANVTSVKFEPITKKIAVGKPFEIAIHIAMDKGWHINANPSSLPFLIPLQVDFSNNKNIEIVEINYPKSNGSVTYDASIIQIYQDSVTIHATLKFTEKPKSVAPKLKALVTLQACQTGTCLSPSDILLKEPVKVK